MQHEDKINMHSSIWISHSMKWYRSIDPSLENYGEFTVTTTMLQITSQTQINTFKKYNSNELNYVHLKMI